MLRTLSLCLTPLTVVALSGGALPASSVSAAGVMARIVQPDADAPKPADQVKLIESIMPSLARVEYTLQYDKGEGPGSDWFSSAWSFAGASNEGAYDEAAASDWERYIKEERPVERPAFVLAPNRVITSDIRLHPRFIKSIKVRSGETLVDAKVSGYFRTQDMVVLELASPLTGAKPLAFDASKSGPYQSVRQGYRSGAWVVGVGGLGGSVAVASDGRKYSRVGDDILIVDKAGTPVALWSNTELPLDDSWKGSPDKWQGVSQSDLERMIASIDKDASSNVVRTTVNFRSPRQGDAGSGGGYGRRFGGYGGMYGEDSEAGGGTEWNGLAVVVDRNTAIVMANFKPRRTARLERIRVFTADGTAITGKFAGTLKDYGGFLVTLDKPIETPVKFASGPVTDLRGTLLVKNDVQVRGETRTAYLMPERIESFYQGYKGRIYPAISESRRRSYNPYGDEGGGQLTFIYTTDGKLAVMPLGRREKVAAESDRFGGYYRMPGQGGGSIPVAELAEVLGDRAKSIDPENRPLTQEEENRVAWLGAELQALDPELARANNVVELTGGGRNGGLVTYVYPESPAAKAGIEVGDILLRLHVEGQPKPLDVQGDGGYGGGFGDQFFAMMDRMPGEYFDMMPSPFGSAETPLMRSLTDIGFGTKFKLEVFRNGKAEMKDMVITQGPDHYGSAKRFKSEAAGMTVRNLTYEVRRFLQLKNDDPGVIVSKTERGEKASIAGVKPFEIITSVNDKPVKNVDELEAALKDGGDFKISVKRQTTGRIVKMKIDSEEQAKVKAKDKPKAPEGEMPEMPAGFPGMPGGR